MAKHKWSGVTELPWVWWHYRLVCVSASEILFDLLPLFILLPCVLSGLPLSCSHCLIGRSAGDMWHSDICHLLFAPANAFYEFTKRLERSTSLLCAFFFTHHIQGGSFWFISECFIIFFFNCRWWVSQPAQPIVQRGEVRSPIVCGSAPDCQWLGGQKKEENSGFLWTWKQVRCKDKFSALM